MRKECIRPWEKACPTKMFGADRDEYGCVKSAGYRWCNSTKTCIRDFESACPGDRGDRLASASPSCCVTWRSDGVFLYDETVVEGDCQVPDNWVGTNKRFYQMSCSDVKSIGCCVTCPVSHPNQRICEFTEAPKAMCFEVSGLIGSHSYFRQMSCEEAQNQPEFQKPKGCCFSYQIHQPENQREYTFEDSVEVECQRKIYDSLRKKTGVRFEYSEMTCEDAMTDYKDLHDESVAAHA